MAPARKPTIVGRHLLRALLRLARIYWTSPDAKWGAAAARAARSRSSSARSTANVRLADARAPHPRRARDTQAAAVLRGHRGLPRRRCSASSLVSTYRIYVRQALEIRWRRGLTGALPRALDRPAGLLPGASCTRGEIDNPDQRIAEDVRDFVASALGLSLSLLSAVATLVSFGGLLWSALGRLAVPLGGAELRIPGLMLWVAIAYAVLSTWLTHLRRPPARPDQLRPPALRGRLPLRAGALPRQRRGGGALARRGRRAARRARCASAT